MSDVRVVELSEKPVLSVRVTSPPDKLGGVFAELFGEISAYIRAQGGQMAGMPFTRYHGMGEGVMDVECGVPVASLLPAAGRIAATTLPGGRAAVLSHYGPYDTLGEAHERLQAWLAEEELEAAGPTWEVYVTDPGEEPDPAKWRTDIYCPLAGA